MHDTTVTMKDGSVFCGAVWTFRPQEGFLTLTDAPDERLYFRDMVSAVQAGGRGETATSTGVDHLARARANGWNGT